ncbi:hypothetical protein FQR65_LT16505 [Abscondita terminalis]|nr:hypothetical protein FQR65_LT16505 [Abscondita terminalis]
MTTFESFSNPEDNFNDIHDIHFKINVGDKGPKEAPLSIFPTLWFEHLVAWGYDNYKPELSVDFNGIKVDHQEILIKKYTERSLFSGNGFLEPFAKDGINQYILTNNAATINPEKKGTKAALKIETSLLPGEKKSWRFRLGTEQENPFADFDQIFGDRMRKTQVQAAKLFCRIDVEQAVLSLQCLQMAKRRTPRNHPPKSATEYPERGLANSNNKDIISMPDNGNILDSYFAKVSAFTASREWYNAPQTDSCQAYEWNFSDVNPPVHAMGNFQEIEDKTDSRIPKSFFLILMLFLSIKGKINFLQLERFSNRCESGFRYFFEQSFDFLTFNKTLISMTVKGKTALAFDPSYISKAGKKTPGVGYFWSGCTGKSKWGLEFCALAVLDLTRKTAFHLFGFQTVDLQDNEKLIAFYVRKILEKKEDLLRISKYLVADAYFSKITFVKPFVETGFHIVSRLRDDADLQYIFVGEQKKGRGRPQQYAGKINFKNLNKKYIKRVVKLESERVYSLKAYSKSMKMDLNLVIVYSKNSKGNWSHKIYFSTDLEQNWKEILERYRLRFQIEFLYRDAKQFTGLNDCEARSKNKLNFHWNMSLTAINLAKITHWIPKKDEKPSEDIVFSMSDIKTQYYNELLLNRFISMFGINPELEKNKHKIKQFLNFGKIAA